MQLKIWHKMIIGIAIPSFIAVLGGVLTYGYINDVKNRQSFVQIADDLKEHVLEIRRNEKNFLHYKNDEHLKNLHDAISVLTSSIKSISPETVEDIGEEDFSLLNEAILTYSNLMGNLYESYQQETKVAEKVRVEGRRLETFAAKGKHAVELTTSFILNLRRVEKNYMLFRDKKSFLELNIELSELENLTPICFECTPYIDAIHSLFKTYRKSDSITNDLQVAGDRLEKLTGEIASRERQKISSFITLTKRLLLIALFLLCTLGPLFVYKTATYIVAPIKRLSEITRKISSGDLTLRAPLKERDETYFLALSFNTMLDHLRNREAQLIEKEKEVYQSKKLASIGILTSGVAHELTNPLNNISMIAQTYEELYDKLGREDRIEFMNKVEKEAERIKDIVKNLLDFSKPKEKSLKEADINTVIGKSLKLVQNMLDVSNIETVINLEAGLHKVFIDEHQMQQVFVNLLVNAIQAMSGGGVLCIETGLSKNKDFVEIDIKDTGKGIPPEFLPHIFDPFFSTKGVEGTGLGLSISYGIIKNHNGNIKVESKVGEGTTFTIELPVYKGREEKDERTT